MKKIIILMVTAVLMFGCATVPLAYKEAKKNKSIESYENFLKTNPDSKYSKKAKAKIEKLKFTEAINTNTEESLTMFIEEYPNSKYLKKIKIALDPFAFRNAENENTIEAFYKYVQDYPRGRNIRSAKLKIELLRYDKALEENTIECYKKYINDYPNSYSDRFKVIKSKLIDLEYYNARNIGSIEAYKAFQEKYSNNKYSSLVKELIYQDDPKIDFTKSKFISFRLRHPSSPAMNTWLSCYDEFLYKKAGDKSYGYTELYCQYLTYSPNSVHYNEIMTKLLTNDISDIYSKANFDLAAEYIKRHPDVESTGKIDSDVIANNELEYLREIYISSAIDSALVRAQEFGVSDSLIAEFLTLKDEIMRFESLDIKNPDQCKTFIRDYPNCPIIKSIREEVFNCNYLTDSQRNNTAIADLVYWVPEKEATQFYKTNYDNLLRETEAETDSSAIVEILKPWIICNTYKLDTLEEKIFLADLFSWFGLLELRQDEINNASICYLTAASIVNTCYSDVATIYFIEALEEVLENILSMDIMSSINSAKQKMSVATDNIENIRKSLNLLGELSCLFGDVDFLTTLSEYLNASDEEGAENSMATMEEIGKVLDTENDVYRSGINMLTKLFEIDKDCWQALRAFNLFPERAPLEAILLMPRFYDYESRIEEYLLKFQDEALIVAKDWIENSNETNKIERGYFVLGFFQIKTDINKLTETNKYWLYYNIRNGIQVSKYRQLLIDIAAQKDEIALVLYNRCSENEETPQQLTNWLHSEIDNKKYTDNETLHIFYPLIRNMEHSEKINTINKMYNSYNIEWSDAASEFYRSEIPDELTEGYIKEILEGSVPYKKLELIKYIIELKLPEYSDYIESYLLGNYYTAGDSEIIRRNLVNLYTKDIYVGYNEQINYSAVNRVVDSSEKIYKSLFIQLASTGLDILDYETAVKVIISRFLTEDQLCIIGAEWIVKNYDPNNSKLKPSFDNIKTNSKIQEAVLTFLQTYFDDNPDFTTYSKQCEKLKQSDQWMQLVTLDAQYGNKDSSETNIEEKGNIKNPIEDWQLNILRENVAQRFLQLLDLN